MQSKRDGSDKLMQFHGFAQTAAVVFLWGTFKYCGSFSKTEIGENVQPSGLGLSRAAGCR